MIFRVWVVPGVLEARNFEVRVQHGLWDVGGGAHNDGEGHFPHEKSPTPAHKFADKSP